MNKTLGNLFFFLLKSLPNLLLGHWYWLFGAWGSFITWTCSFWAHWYFTHPTN